MSPQLKESQYEVHCQMYEIPKCSLTQFRMCYSLREQHQLEIKFNKFNMFILLNNKNERTILSKLKAHTTVRSGYYSFKDEKKISNYWCIKIIKNILIRKIRSLDYEYI